MQQCIIVYLVSIPVRGFCSRCCIVTLLQSCVFAMLLSCRLATLLAYWFAVLPLGCFAGVQCCCFAILLPGWPVLPAGCVSASLLGCPAVLQPGCRWMPMAELPASYPARLAAWQFCWMRLHLALGRWRLAADAWLADLQGRGSAARLWAVVKE